MYSVNLKEGLREYVQSPVRLDEPSRMSLVTFIIGASRRKMVQDMAGYLPKLLNSQEMPIYTTVLMLTNVHGTMYSHFVTQGVFMLLHCRFIYKRYITVYSSSWPSWASCSLHFGHVVFVDPK